MRSRGELPCRNTASTGTDAWPGDACARVGLRFREAAPPNPLCGPLSDAAYLASFLQTIPGPIVVADLVARELLAKITGDYIERFTEQM